MCRGQWSRRQCLREDRPIATAVDAPVSAVTGVIASGVIGSAGVSIDRSPLLSVLRVWPSPAVSCVILLGAVGGGGGGGAFFAHSRRQY